MFLKLGLKHISIVSAWIDQSESQAKALLGLLIGTSLFCDKAVIELRFMLGQRFWLCRKTNPRSKLLKTLKVSKWLHIQTNPVINFNYNDDS